MFIYKYMCVCAYTYIYRKFTTPPQFIIYDDSDARCSIVRLFAFFGLAWPHRHRGLASDGVQYADARSSVGRRFRSVMKLKLEWGYGGVVLLVQQRSEHPREMVITPKASTSLFWTGSISGVYIASTM